MHYKKCFKSDQTLSPPFVLLEGDGLGTRLHAELLTSALPPPSACMRVACATYMHCSAAIYMPVGLLLIARIQIVSFSKAHKLLIRRS